MTYNPETWKALPPLVEVFWEDHYSIGDDWYEVDHKHEACVLSAVGYLVHEDDMYMYVACTYELDSGKYSAGTAVLKNCIVAYRQYTQKEALVTSSQPSQKTRSRAINLKRKPAQKNM